MPNTTSKSNKSRKRKRERSFISPSPAFSISSNGSIKDYYEEILENPDNLPLDPRKKTMINVVKNFSSPEVVKVYEKFQNDENDVKGGKKKKRITIKKKKARKTLKKPMFKRNK